ncbi:hypothetical protein CFOL_v3_31568 [Cephalotus follicularis]|uniref:Vacuolar ATPase assembly protein VMA22 n=1 Tax=Cephalotus follicularis TaxID=3775 RepID=A0A1Q3D6R6_CEPFO|nr:hypothetical protein CFOL_v3_31568 [Cephalotus follicularis]
MEKEEDGETKVEDEKVMEFLDSVDTYLFLFDSLSSTLRQGWLEFASARHSMGVSRVNGALLDLKSHSAATSLQVTQVDDSVERQPHFILHKWISSDNGQDCYKEGKFREDKLCMKIDTPQLRNRSNALLSEEKASARNGAPLDQIQKERSKSLSVFGTLVSPKLRAAQLSFETALETLVEIANMRSKMLSSFDQLHNELKAPTDHKLKFSSGGAVGNEVNP